MAQAEEQVVAQGAGKQVRRGADIADAAADHRGRERRDVVPADRDPSAGRLDQAGEQQGELVLAAAALADDRDMLVERNCEADPVEDAAAVVLGERQIGDRPARRSAAPRFPAPRAASRASIMPAGWNCSTICSYLIRESSFI